MNAGLLIVGAGGHGKVVAEAAQLSGRWQRIAFADDRHPALTQVLGWPVLGTLEALTRLRAEFDEGIVALGDNAARRSWHQRLFAAGYRVPCIVHPRAVVSAHATLGPGTVVCAQAVVGVDAVVGAACLINTAATVDHDCVLGEGVHVSAGAHLAGGVHAGDGVVIGVGAAAVQGVRISAGTVVAAGAVVKNA